MVTKNQKLLLNYLNLPIDVQDKIIKEYNDQNNDKLRHYEINPLNLDKDPRLQKLAPIIEKYQNRK